MFPLKEKVPEVKSDFSRANEVVTSPVLPKPSASDPATKATRALRTRSSAFSVLKINCGPSSAMRRIGRLAVERRVQCQSSGSEVASRLAGRSEEHTSELQSP